MSKQLGLFTRQRSLNVGRDFKDCLATLVSESGLSRSEFLEKMNAVADRYGIRLMKGNGNGLTMATFEKWLNVDQARYVPPLSAITVICEVSGSIEPLRIFSGALGVEVISEERMRRLLWADAYFEERDARKRKKRLEEEI